MKKLPVGNLPRSTTKSELRGPFADVGEPHSPALTTERHTPRSREFGCFKMAGADTDNAIMQLSGKALDRQALRVNSAMERFAHG
jgi:hypothetical protein